MHGQGRSNYFLNYLYLYVIDDIIINAVSLISFNCVLRNACHKYRVDKNRYSYLRDKFQVNFKSTSMYVLFTSKLSNRIYSLRKIRLVYMEIQPLQYPYSHLAPIIRWKFFYPHETPKTPKRHTCFKFQCQATSPSLSFMHRNRSRHITKVCLTLLWSSNFYVSMSLLL